MRFFLGLVTVTSLSSISYGFISTTPLSIYKQHSHRIDKRSCEINVSNRDDSEFSKDVELNEKILSSKNRRSFLSQFVSTTASAAVATLTSPKASIAASTSSKVAVTSVSAAVPTPPFTSDVSWPLGKVAFSLLPLAGTSTRRATVEEVIVPGQIWTHDQIQGVVNVNVPVRQTVIKLSKEAGGGLWIHNPVAPTPQLLEMIRNLEKQHGPVRHIVLGTVALEHKATFGPFASKFPKATVWFQPGQWSFPLNVPIEYSGVDRRGPLLREIPPPSGKVSNTLYQHFQDISPVPEWTADISYEMLYPLKFKSVGAFSETAFFHKATKSLIITDTVVSVTKTPPKIIQEDPRAMLFHARDYSNELVQDTPETREKGWRRMVQFGLVFFPSQIDVMSVSGALNDSKNLDPSLKNLGDGAVPIGLYPWTWHTNNADGRNFETISKKGALFCPPILTKLILDREPEKTLEWVDRVSARFPFERIIPGHLNNNVKAGPKEFRAAFDPLRNDPKTGITYKQRPLDEDLALLQKASDLLTKLNVVDASKICDGEGARIVGRFADKALK